MHGRHRTLFRGLIVLYVALVSTSLATAFLLPDPLDEAIDEFRWSIHPGIQVSWNAYTGLIIANTGLLLLSLGGLFFFWAHARWIFVISILLGYSIGHIVGTGPVVYPLFAYDLGGMSVMCAGAILAMSFIGPIADEFLKTRDSQSNE